jgi:hypothetical protein
MSIATEYTQYVKVNMATADEYLSKATDGYESARLRGDLASMRLCQHVAATAEAARQCFEDALKHSPSSVLADLHRFDGLELLSACESEFHDIL